MIGLPPPEHGWLLDSIREIGITDARAIGLGLLEYAALARPDDDHEDVIQRMTPQAVFGLRRLMALVDQEYLDLSELN